MVELRWVWKQVIFRELGDGTTLSQREKVLQMRLKDKFMHDEMYFSEWFDVPLDETIPVT